MDERNIAKMKAALFGVVALAAGVCYLFTMSGTTLEIDVGELAAAQALAGIPHPTGYPLFTMLGWLFAQIPSPLSTIAQLNLLSAILTAAAAGGVATASFEAFRNLDAFRVVPKTAPKKTRKRRGAKRKPKRNLSKKAAEVTIVAEPEPLDLRVALLAAGAAGLFAAFGETFWLQSVAAEVYALHLAVLSLALNFLVKARTAPEDEAWKYWYGLAGALALGFANHMTTLMLLPGIAYLYFQRHSADARSLERLGKMIAVFVPILAALYAYLPLRAAADPPLNWGDPTTWENFVRHVTGAQYRVWMFQSIESAQRQIEEYVASIPDVSTIGALFAVFGAAWLWRRGRALLWFLAVSVVFTVLYASTYEIHDIETYYLLADVSIALFAGAGVAWGWEKLRERKVPVVAYGGGVAAVVAVAAFLNFGDADRSDTTTFRDYTLAALASVDSGAVVFTYQWDYFFSPAYYFQKIEGVRPDVALVEKELLRRSWYYEQLRTNSPDVYEGIEHEARTFIRLVAPFERDESFDPAPLEAAYRAVMTKVVSSNLGKRPVYVAPELYDTEMRNGQFSLPPGAALVPELFFFRVTTSDDYVEAPLPDFEIDFSEENQYVAATEDIVGTALLRRALYEAGHNRIDRARAYMKKIETDLPRYRVSEKARRTFERLMSQ
jgi:hypothetical protein